MDFLDIYPDKKPSRTINIMRSIPYVMFILIIAVIFMLFVGVRNSMASWDYTFNDLTLGEIDSQDGWTEGVPSSLHTIQNGTVLEGKALLASSTVGATIQTYKNNFTAGTAGTQCFWLKIEKALGSYLELNIKQDSGNIIIGTIRFEGQAFDIYEISVLEDGDYNYSGYDWTLNQWSEYCIIYDTVADTVQYLIQGNYTTATTTNATTQADEIDITGGNNFAGYFDYFTSSYTGFNPSSDALTWFWPQQDYVISNSEWNDWGLFYDLESDNLGDWNILMVHYTDPDGSTYTDWEEITTTTDLTYWTINRENNLSDGLVYSQAEIIKIEDCDSYYDEDCVWTDVAETGVITWTSSSTGYTIFDNPWHLPGFTPSSSTVETEQEEDIGFLGGFWNIYKRVFPLSLYFDIYDIFTAVENRELEPVSINLNELVPSKYGLDFGASTTLLSSDIMNDSLPVWETKVYPSLKTLIWLFTFVYLIIFGLKVFKHD